MSETRPAGAARLDADGWFRTGDIGRWVEGAGGGGRRAGVVEGWSGGGSSSPLRGVNRLLEVVDRLGFAVKLSNGESWSRLPSAPLGSSRLPWPDLGSSAPLAPLKGEFWTPQRAEAAFEAGCASVDRRVRDHSETLPRPSEIIGGTSSRHVSRVPARCSRLPEITRDYPS